LRRIYRYTLYIIGAIFVVILGIIFPQYYIKLSGFYPFGFAFIIILIMGDLFVDILQGKSPHVITRAGDTGYWSINRKDILYIPWYKNNGGNKKLIGEMVIMFVGGVDYWGINPKSNCEYPVLIFPSIYLKKIGLCYEVDCNMRRFKFSELPPTIRHYLNYKWGNRIKESTSIYFGATSIKDGTATPENDNLLEKMRTENEYVSKIEEINGNLYKELKKYDERKAKQYFIKEAGNVEET